MSDIGLSITGPSNESHPGALEKLALRVSKDNGVMVLKDAKTGPAAFEGELGDQMFNRVDIHNHVIYVPSKNLSEWESSVRIVNPDSNTMEEFDVRPLPGELKVSEAVSRHFNHGTDPQPMDLDLGDISLDDIDIGSLELPVDDAAIDLGDIELTDISLSSDQSINLINVDLTDINLDSLEAASSDLNTGEIDLESISLDELAVFSGDLASEISIINELDYEITKLTSELNIPEEHQEVAIAYLKFVQTANIVPQEVDVSKISHHEIVENDYLIGIDSNGEVKSIRNENDSETLDFIDLKKGVIFTSKKFNENNKYTTITINGFQIKLEKKFVHPDAKKISKLIIRKKIILNGLIKNYQKLYDDEKIKSETFRAIIELLILFLKKELISELNFKEKSKFNKKFEESIVLASNWNELRFSENRNKEKSLRKMLDKENLIKIIELGRELKRKIN